MKHWIILAAAALIGGAFYGFTLATLTVLLNTPSLRAARARLALLTGFGLLYAAAAAVPLFVAGALSCRLLGASSNFGAATIFELSMLVIAMITLFNGQQHPALCTPRTNGLILLLANGASMLNVLVAAIGLTVGWTPALITGVIVFPVIIVAVMALNRSAPTAPAAGDTTALAIQRPPDFERVIWFGIDSATWDMLDPLIAAGRLPNIAAAVRDGYSARLKSMIPTRSPMIWTSKVTGKTPIQHGVKDFLVFDIRGVGEPFQVLPLDPLLKKLVPRLARAGLLKRRPTGSTERKTLALWNLTSAAGYPTGVVSWLVTDPAEQINGFMVPEFFYAMEKKQFDFKGSAVHPAAADAECQRIKADMDARYRAPESNEYMKTTFGVTGPIEGPFVRKMDILKAFHYHDQLRVATARHMLAKQTPDLTMIYLHGVDASQHHFWGFRNAEGSPYKEIVARYYEYADRVLGELLQLIPGPKTVIITSDHGHRNIKLHEQMTDRFLGRPKLTGSHADGPDGVLILQGSKIRAGKAAAPVSLYDIVPTLLPLFGMPAAADMDGRPLAEAFTQAVKLPPSIPTYEGRVTTASGESRDLAENEHVLGRLKDLGYI